jgi:hypothetical protein
MKHYQKQFNIILILTQFKNLIIVKCNILCLIEIRLQSTSSEIHNFIDTSKYNYVSVFDGHEILMLYDGHMILHLLKNIHN